MRYRTQVQLLDFINPGLLYQFSPDELTVQEPTTNEELALSLLAENRFGKKICYFTNSAPNKIMFDGASITGSNLIFINKAAKTPLHVVFGHELLHHIKHDSLSLYKDFNNTIQSRFQETEAFHTWQDSKLPFLVPEIEEAIEEELMADFVGNHFSSSKFWANSLSISLEATAQVQRYSSNMFNRFLRVGDELSKELSLSLMDEISGIKGAIQSAHALLKDYSDEHLLKQPINTQNPLTQNLELMYMGVNSQLANLSKLQQAITLLKSDYDDNDVRKQTGWFKGLDSKLRYEISEDSAVFYDLASLKAEIPRLMLSMNEVIDNYKGSGLSKVLAIESLQVIENRQAVLKDILAESNKTLPDRLGAMWYHPDLYKSYPGLRHVKVLFSTELPPSSLGFAYINNNLDLRDAAIYLNSTELFGRPNPLQEVTHVLSHETQHLVQFIEEFSSGSSIDDNLSWAANILRKRSRESVERLGKKWETSKLTEDKVAFETAQENHESKEYLKHSESKAYSLYSRHYGEVEANDTANRRLLTEAERMEIPPLTLTATKGMNLIVETDRGYYAKPPNVQLIDVDAITRTKSKALSVVLNEHYYQPNNKDSQKDVSNPIRGRQSAGRLRP